MTAQCPICRCPDLSAFARLRTPYLDQREFYDIVQCRRCGHGFARGRDDPQFLQRIYSTGFHDTSQQRTNDAASPVRVNARVRAEELHAKGIGGRLLDVGAGNGAFVEAAAEFFDAEGVEFAAATAAAAAARGLRVRGGDFLSMEISEKAYDIVTLWDVLAGLHDPHAAVARCGALVKDGGHVLMTLPMIDSVAARLLKRAWPLLIPPVNLHYFSRQGIARLAADHGLAVSALNYPGKQVALNFLAMKAARSIGQHALATCLGRVLPAVSVSVNTRDIACVLLQSGRGAAT